MKCPPEIAASFLRKWQDESTLLLVSLSDGSRVSISTTGMVAAFDPGMALAISFAALKPPSPSNAGIDVSRAPGEIIVSLEGASFEYADPRDASPATQEASEAVTVCVLSIKIPDDHAPDLLLVLTELKEEGFTSSASL